MRLLRQLQPALAALLAACVLLLGLAAASPDLHESLCASGHDHAACSASAHHDHAEPHPAPDAPDAPLAAASDDHVCAVTLFAHGCTATVPATLVSPPVLNATTVAHFTEFMLARTLRGPARVCGPPALA